MRDASTPAETAERATTSEPRSGGPTGPISRAWQSFATFCEMIKISHSVFALPFALAAALLAAGGLPDPWLLVQIILACVFARTTAMAFNRRVDAEIDARNPRTASRALPAGALSRRAVEVFTALFAALFVIVCATINTLALALSPVALLVLLGYSLTKRFWRGSHLVLGLALALSPVGAWIAVRGEFALVPILLGAAVLFWTAGFDVIYACQDIEVDRRERLHSLPSHLGARAALWISRAFHVLTVIFLLLTGWQAAAGVAFHGGIALVAALLIYEHSLVRADDLSRVNVAFFTLNGLVSIAFLGAVALDVLGASS